MSVGVNVVRPVSSVTEAIHELITLAERYNISVNPGQDSRIVFEDQVAVEITYNRKYSKSMILWALAHELGHLFIVESCKKSMTNNFIGSKVVTWVKEAELQAWCIADALLLQMNPRFYDIRYMRYKQSQLKTYYR